jgi:hypothetical protein
MYDPNGGTHRLSKAIDELLSRQAQDEADADTKRRHALLIEEEFKQREQPFVDEVLDRIRRAAEFNNSHPLHKEVLLVIPHESLIKSPYRRS